MKIKNKKDFGLGIGTLLLSIWIIWSTMQLPPAEYGGDPGPKMFPMIGGVLMGVCAIILIIRQDPPQGEFMTKQQWKDAGIFFGTYILVLLLMYVFGWTVALPIALFVLTYELSSISMPDATKKKRLITSLIWAVCCGAGIYLAYKVGLKARLPKGLMNKFYKQWF